MRTAAIALLLAATNCAAQDSAYVAVADLHLAGEAMERSHAITETAIIVGLAGSAMTAIAAAAGDTDNAVRFAGATIGASYTLFIFGNDRRYPAARRLREL